MPIPFPRPPPRQKSPCRCGMRRRPGRSDRERRGGAFAQPHAQIEQRRFAETAEHLGVGVFSGDMRCETMIERARIERVQHRRRRRHDEAVEQDRHTLDARGDIAPAIAAISRPPRRRSASSGSLRCSRCSATAAPTASAFRFRRRRRRRCPFRPSPPASRRRARDRSRRRSWCCRCPCRRGRAGPGRRQRLHAERHGRRAGALVERRLARDVAGRLLQRELVDFQRNVEGLADLVDRGAARGEIGDHRLRHRGGVGRDAFSDHAVIAGEDGDQRRIDMRSAALPGRQKLAISSSRPSEPAGSVSCACRSRAAASACASGVGIPFKSARISSNGRGEAVMGNALGSRRRGLLKQNRGEGKHAPPAPAGGAVPEGFRPRR